MISPKIDQNILSRADSACATTAGKKTKNNRKFFGCLTVFLLVLVLLGVLYYPSLRMLRRRAWCSSRIVAIEREILKPLKEKLDFPDDPELRIPGDISFSKNFIVSFSLEIRNPEQATEILKDIYALKQQSPGLSREVFDVEIVCNDPKNPVKFRVVMPGENGYEGRRTVYPSDLNPTERESKEPNGATE